MNKDVFCTSVKLYVSQVVPSLVYSTKTPAGLKPAKRFGDNTGLRAASIGA